MAELTTLLNTLRDEKEVKTTKYYSERFSDICKIFGLKEVFKVEHDVEKVVENKTGGRYIFPKCMQCKIVYTANKKKSEMSNEIREKDLKQFILDDMGKTDKKLSKYIIDTHFDAYLSQKCPLIYPEEKNDKHCCEEYSNENCIPYLINELLKKYKKYNGKIGVFSTVELETLCNIFYRILSINNNPKEYKKSVELQLKKMKGKDKNSFISYQAATYGKMQDYQIREILQGMFRDYYVKQCLEHEKAEELYMKLSSYQDLKKISWKPEIIVVQTSRWKKKWLYIFERFNKLRMDEAKISSSNRLQFDIFMQLIIWEISYENFDADEINEEQDILESSIFDNEQDHVLAENTKMREKGKVFIKEFLTEVEKRQEYLLENDKWELYERAFLDLERVLDYISMGWKNPRTDSIYTGNIINSLHEKYERRQIVEVRELEESE